MGGAFTEILNAAGAALVGDPALGTQVASQARPGFAPITQNAGQISRTVLPAAQAALDAPQLIDFAKISGRSQQVAQSTLPETAAQLADAGYVFPAGSVGESLTRPSFLAAFGGQNERLVILAGLALAGLFALKAL